MHGCLVSPPVSGAQGHFYAETGHLRAEGNTEVHPCSISRATLASMPSQDEVTCQDLHGVGWAAGQGRTARGVGQACMAA